MSPWAELLAPADAADEVIQKLKKRRDRALMHVFTVLIWAGGAVVLAACLALIALIAFGIAAAPSAAPEVRVGSLLTAVVGVAAALVRRAYRTHKFSSLKEVTDVYDR